MAAIVVPWRTSKGAAPSPPSQAKGSRPIRRSTLVKLGPGLSSGRNIGRLIAGRTLPAPGRHAGRLLAALLDVAADELLGVLLEHAVDLVQQLVELRLELVALAVGGGDLLDRLLLPGGGLLLHLLSFWHRRHSPQEPNRSSRSAGLEELSSKSSTWARVPLSGSIIGTRRSGSTPRSNTSESQLAAAIDPAHFWRHRPRKYALVVSGGSVTARSTSAGSSRRSIPSRC